MPRKPRADPCPFENGFAEQEEPPRSPSPEHFEEKFSPFEEVNTKMPTIKLRYHKYDKRFPNRFFEQQSSTSNQNNSNSNSNNSNSNTPSGIAATGRAGGNGNGNNNNNNGDDEEDLTRAEAYDRLINTVYTTIDCRFRNSLKDYLSTIAKAAAAAGMDGECSVVLFAWKGLDIQLRRDIPEPGRAITYDGFEQTLRGWQANWFESWPESGGMSAFGQQQEQGYGSYGQRPEVNWNAYNQAFNEYAGGQGGYPQYLQLQGYPPNLGRRGSRHSSAGDANMGYRGMPSRGSGSGGGGGILFPKYPPRY
ncbi:hypothetical protein B0J14DRAFT_573080 [Halenospora varia]|nr:hypothetical protein B0J14DRAFT_573080 [Halenospora varia]